VGTARGELCDTRRAALASLSRHVYSSLSCALALAVLAASSTQHPPLARATPLESGTFPASWIAGGPACPGEPQFQVHAYNPDFYIVRQSLCTDFEAPFLYLIFGSQRAILFDTGAGGVPAGNKIREIRDAWLAAHGMSSIPLVVAHLHSHGDHTAGDGQFIGQPNTTVVGTSVSAVQNFFGFTSWPTQRVEFDLGGRVLDILAIPGHQSAHIAVYDRHTGILLTGDSLYPGRLYVSGATGQGNWDIYKASMQRLVDFAGTRPITWVLGTHIEMSTTPGDDYSTGVTYHPSEHVLQLTLRHLIELNSAIHAQTSPHIEVHDDFIVYPFG
jgi:glyoxylase-like metal-dependent hydrolase (beta-lactamase superfamily II)